jgi:hypothetical protein
MVRTPWDAWCWSPLRNKVSEDLALDGVAVLEVELKTSKLCRPLGDVARGVGIVEDGPQRVRGYHHNLVGLEIMAELQGRNEYSIKKLMRLRISGLCFMKDLTDVVDRLLDSLDFASETGPFSLSWGLAGPQVTWFSPGSGPGRTLRSRVGCHIGGGRTSTSCRGDRGGPLQELLEPLSDQHHADYFSCRCKVQKQRLPWVRRYQDW